MYESAHMQGKEEEKNKRENITYSFVITSMKLIQSHSYTGNF